MTTGERIRAVRKKKGLTQKQLADRCGMADSAIRKYESGRIKPKLETIQRIATALDADLLEFVDLYPGEDTPKSFESTRSISETIKKGREVGKRLVFRDGALILEYPEPEKNEQLERGNQILQDLALKYDDSQSIAGLVEHLNGLSDEDQIALTVASTIMFFSIQKGDILVVGDDGKLILPPTGDPQDASAPQEDEDTSPAADAPEGPPEDA